MVCGWEHVGGRLHVKGVSVGVRLWSVRWYFGTGAGEGDREGEGEDEDEEDDDEVMDADLLRFTLLDSYSMPWGVGWLVGGLQEDRSPGGGRETSMGITEGGPPPLV